MFPLKSFIQAIQEAILNASDTLMEKNMELLNRYFEEEGSDDIKEKIDQAILASENVTDPNVKVTRQSLNNAVESIKSLKDSLSSSDDPETLIDRDLHPKMVTMNYPTKSKDGSIGNKEVHVPLLTLVPIAFSQVNELKLKADLELNLVDEELQVGFGKVPRNPKPAAEGQEAEPGSKGSIGSVEITIKAQEVSDGMQHVIDAYEKVLKAQLPL